MKIIFIDDKDSLPNAEDFDLAQTKDGESLFKSIDGEWVLFEGIYKEVEEKVEKPKKDGENGPTEFEAVINKVFQRHTFDRNIPSLDFGFEEGKPTKKGMFRDEDLSLKYIHKASSYGLEATISSNT